MKTITGWVKRLIASDRVKFIGLLVILAAIGAYWAQGAIRPHAAYWHATVNNFYWGHYKLFTFLIFFSIGCFLIRKLTKKKKTPVCEVCKRKTKTKLITKEQLSALSKGAIDGIDKVIPTADETNKEIQ